MNRVEATVTVDADAQTCFDFVAEPTNLPRFMTAIKVHRPQGGKHRGKGARFESIADIAGRDFEMILVMTEWTEGERIAVASESGLKLRTTFVFEEFDDGTTDVTLVNEYEPPGVFRLMGALVRSTADKAVKESLQNLKRVVEKETRKAPSVRAKKAR